MKNSLTNAVENQAKPVKAGARTHVRLAKVVAAKPSYNKRARQAFYSKAASCLPVSKAISQAKLISEVNPAEFRIIRMPG